MNSDTFASTFVRISRGLLVPVVCIFINYAAIPDSVASPGGADDEAVRVVVSPSAKEPEPIAVPDMLCGDVDKATCSMLTTVLRRDLNLSGVFRVTNPKSYFATAKPHGEDIPFADWFNVGARYLVQGYLTKGKTTDVRLSLYDVVEKKRIPFSLKPVAKGRKIDAVMMVHRHVNAFIFSVTGRHGIFGSRIVFSKKVGSGHKDIMTIRFGDLKPSVRVGDGTSNLFPAIGPGGRLLYTSFKRDKPDIYIDGELLTQDDFQYRSARISPSGQEIAVSVDKGDGQSDIWLMAKNGAFVKNLTNSPEDEVSPRWSRDGKWVAYVSNRTGNPQIYGMSKDGSGKRRISMAGSYNTSPDFGPDGRVVFAGMDDFVSEIFTTDMAGNMQRITQQQGSNKDPCWSPDGKYIVFVSTRNRKTQLFVGTEDGRWQFPLFEAPGVYSTPSWHW